MKTDKGEVTKLLKNKDITGYVWMVSEKYPFIFYKEAIDIDNLYKTNEPFNLILEAYLTNGKHSIKIMSVDGVEHYYSYSLCDFSNENEFKIDKEAESYPSHLQKCGIDSLQFKTVYKLTETLSGNEFKTWQPILQYFVGMKTNDNLKNGELCHK